MIQKTSRFVLPVAVALIADLRVSSFPQMADFQKYVQNVGETAAAASQTLGNINFRAHPTPSWCVWPASVCLGRAHLTLMHRDREVVLQRLRLLSKQLQRLNELLYGGSTSYHPSSFIGSRLNRLSFPSVGKAVAIRWSLTRLNSSVRSRPPSNR
jgi:hypothetical protein